MKNIFNLIKRIFLICFILILTFMLYSFIFHKVSTKRENKILENYDLGEVIEVNGLEVNYKIFNENNTNNTIVFLSGLGTNDLALTLEPFAEKINSKIILINRPGYSLSEDTKEKATLEYVVEYYRKTLKILNVDEKVILMPSSLGGLYAIEWINKYPNEIKGLVALDITCPYLVVNDTINYMGSEPINPNGFSYKIGSIFSRFYGVIGIHRQLYQFNIYEKYNSYGYYNENVLNAMHYLSLQINDKRFALSENGYLYKNAEKVLKSLKEEYENVSKLIIISNYIDGKFYENYEKEEFLKYYDEQSLNDYLSLLKNIREQEIEFYEKYNNTQYKIVEGPHVIYEYPSDELITIINNFISTR